MSIANKKISPSIFKKIKIKSPSDDVLEQIRNLIISGVFKPGNRLPSERTLSEQFGVGRGYIRKAITQLEFYGILKTYPQRGTFVASLGIKALENLITNVLKLGKEDFLSLMETRSILEINATRLASKRANEKDIKELEKYLSDYYLEVKKGFSGIEEDLLFHLKIAEISKNSVLNSLISLMTPDIIAKSKGLDTCREGRFLVSFKEHQNIFRAIKKRDTKKAVRAMENHMRMSEYQVKISSNNLQEISGN